MSGRSRSRRLILFDSDQEDQEGYDPSLEGQTYNDELYGSQEEDVEMEDAEMEDVEMEIQEERRGHRRSGPRDREEGRPRRTSGHSRLSRMIEGLTNTVREMVDAMRPR